jgi:hypothetical protein
LLTAVGPHWQKAGKGKRPYPQRTMLLVDLMHRSYPAMQEALHEVVR